MTGDATASARATSQYATTTGNLTARIALHAYGTNPQSWFAWLGERLPLAGDVLEVGAGTGELWHRIGPHGADQRDARLPLSRTKARQASGVKVSTGPAGSLLSRTPTTAARLSATSTQSPWVPLRVDFRQIAPVSSTRSSRPSSARPTAGAVVPRCGHSPIWTAG